MNANQKIGVGRWQMGLLTLVLSSIFYLLSPRAFAANVRLYFPARTNSAVLLTNTFKAVPISPHILANGGVIPIGLPFNITPGTNGIATNFFAQGFYALTNNLLSQGGVVINVYDNGPQLYDYTNLLWSGYNTYVAIYGTNLPPSLDAITNALGLLPVAASITNGLASSNMVYVGSNYLQSQFTSLYVATNFFATSNSLFVASNLLYSLNVEATNSGITAVQATNISAYQALIATQALRAVVQTGTANLTNWSLLATSAIPHIIAGSGVTVTTNASGRTIAINNNPFVRYQDIDSLNSIQITNEPLNFKDEDGNITFQFFQSSGTAGGIWASYVRGDGSGLTNLPLASLTNSGTMGYSNASAFVPFITNLFNLADTAVSNALSARFVATNSETITRLIATNAALEAKLQRGSLMLTNLSATGAITNVVAGSNATVQIANFTVTVNSIPRTNGLASETFVINATNDLNTVLRALIAASIGGATNNYWGSNIVAGYISNQSVYVKIVGNVDMSTRAITNLARLKFSNLAIDGEGKQNTGYDSTALNLVGGHFNSVTGTASTTDDTILGGRGLTYNVGIGTTYGNQMLGGSSNTFQNSTLGNFHNSTILGGEFCVLDGASSTLIGGHNASATHSGAFVFSDRQSGGFATATNDSAIFRVLGGFGINTNNPGTNALMVHGNTDSRAFSIAQNPFASTTTNNLAVYGAGDNSVNGTYVWSSSRYTNEQTAVILTNVAGTWQFKTNVATVLYSLTQTSPQGSYTIQAGPAAAPLAQFGANLNLTGNNLQGWINSTNLTARLAALTGITALQATNIFNANSPHARGVAEGGQTVYLQGSNNAVTTIGGAVLSGRENTIGTNMPYSVIGGGQGNVIPDSVPVGSGWGFIGGGEGNAGDTSEYFTIGGGRRNKAGSGTGNTIAGGMFNTNNGIAGTIGGGRTNLANGTGTTVAGGQNNSIDGDAVEWSVIGGGRDNSIDGDGQYATIPGGQFNRISSPHGAALGNGLTIATDYEVAVGTSNTAMRVSADGKVNMVSARSTNDVYMGGFRFNPGATSGRLAIMRESDSLNLAYITTNKGVQADLFGPVNVADGALTWDTDEQLIKPVTGWQFSGDGAGLINLNIGSSITGFETNVFPSGINDVVSPLHTTPPWGRKLFADTIGATQVALVKVSGAAGNATIAQTEADRIRLSASALINGSLEFTSATNHGTFTNALRADFGGPVNFNDGGVNSPMVVSNGVIGTMRAATNSGNIQTATLNTTGNATVAGTLGTANFFVTSGPSISSLGITGANGDNLTMPGGFGAFGNYVAATNGFYWPTNGIVANLVAGREYNTNGANNITFGTFASVPTDHYVKSIVIVSNSGAGAIVVTFPNGTAASNHTVFPALFDLPSAKKAIFEVHHLINDTNVVRVY